MKPIEVSYLTLLYTYLVLTGFVYAIPNNIMSYSLTNDFVEWVAFFIPAIEKLKQAYEQEMVSGVALFFHAFKSLIIFILLLLTLQSKIIFSGKVFSDLSKLQIFQCAFFLCLTIFSYWFVLIQGNDVEDVVQNNRMNIWFLTMYIQKETISFFALSYIFLTIASRQILGQIMIRGK